MKKVKYISIYHFCREPDSEYHVSFNRGDKAAETPRYKKTYTVVAEEACDSVLYVASPTTNAHVKLRAPASIH